MVGDDTGGATRLTGLVGVNANVVAGDSGGPLLNSADAVIGMNTAGSTGYVSRSSSVHPGLRDSDRQGTFDRPADRRRARVRA